MEMELNSQKATEDIVIDSSKIKQQVVELKQEQAKGQMTEAELKENRVREMQSIEDGNIIPYLECIKKTKELEVAVKNADIEIIKLDVSMGIRPSNTVPGLLGKKLQLEELQAQYEWAGFQLEVTQRQIQLKEAQDKLEAMKNKPTPENGTSETN